MPGFVRAGNAMSEHPGGHERTPDPVGEGLLVLGDNLEALRDAELFSDSSAQLVYLDPPFNRGTEYFSGARRSGPGFSDRWRWDDEASRGYERACEEASGHLSAALRALRELVGERPLLAYLGMIAPRLAELHRILDETGTLFLHCDPTASHYLKILADALFGPGGFRNEIIWCYSGGGIPKRDFPRKHDVLLRYAKGPDCYYAPVYRPYTAGTVQRGRTAVKGKYAEKGLRPEGTPVTDWWTDVPRITSPTDPEKLGYPTQKPLALLERIIRSATRTGDLVLDPFCGSGTALVAAARLGRRWLGIDNSRDAVDLACDRLRALGCSPSIRGVGL